jgi:ABC-type transport system involved in cytochrome c biogenesis permease subunit
MKHGVHIGVGIQRNMGFINMVSFAIYLHTRLTKVGGRKPALIASLGFVTVWICFLGVNLIGEGLHSYGWFHKSLFCLSSFSRAIKKQDEA